MKKDELLVKLNLGDFSIGNIHYRSTEDEEIYSVDEYQDLELDKVEHSCDVIVELLHNGTVFGYVIFDTWAGEWIVQANDNSLSMMSNLLLETDLGKSLTESEYSGSVIQEFVAAYVDFYEFSNMFNANLCFTRAGSIIREIRGLSSPLNDVDEFAMCFVNDLLLSDEYSSGCYMVMIKDIHNVREIYFKNK